MHYILEEAALMQHANEPETREEQPDIAQLASTPEMEAGAPETPEQEETALVPTEPEVIEGEVVELEPAEPLDASQLPKQKPYWLFIPFAIVLCLLFLAGSYLVPLFTPSATVLLLPTEQHLAITTAIQVHGRLLPTPILKGNTAGCGDTREATRMNQEEREALIHQATQRLIAGLHQTTNAEQMLIRATLTSSGVAMFAAGRRSSEEWIGRILASLPIPMVITRTLPEGEGGQEPVLAYHWHTHDKEGDGVTFAYALEQALLAVLHRQEQQP